MKKIFAFIMVLLAAFTLVACGDNAGSDAEKVAAAKEELKIQTTVSGDTLSAITGRVVLRNKLGTVDITWTSSNEDIVSAAGNVTRPVEDTVVTLTATLTLNDATDTKNFELTVLAQVEPTPAPSETTPEPTPGADWDLPEEFYNFAEGKNVYLTSIGQSGEISTISTMLSVYVFDSGEEFDQKVVVDNMIQASEIPNGSIVILVPAASGKGLGSAGTNLAQEKARAEAFGAKAENGLIDLFVVHIGGATRRGNDTDPLISASAEHAVLLLVQESGNSDGFFDGLGVADTYYYASAMTMVDSFKQIFGKE